MRESIPAVRAPLAVLAAAGLLLVALAVPDRAAAGPDRRGDSFTVVAEGGPFPYSWGWVPAEVTIHGRGRVTWENPTDAVHHVTFWDGPTKTSEHVGVGGSVTLRFRKPGVHRYWCDIFGHADIVYLGTERICVGMCGEVVVE
jgi:plastocyanin